MPQYEFNGLTEQMKASIHRREDAQSLFEASKWRGAMYLSGYSVECLLKAKLMSIFNCSNLRELEDELLRRNLLSGKATIFTHQLEVLLRLTSGMDRLRQNATMWQFFNIVNRWIPAWRYNPDLSSADDSKDFLEAIDNIRRWIENNL